MASTSSLPPGPSLKRERDEDGLQIPLGRSGAQESPSSTGDGIISTLQRSPSPLKRDHSPDRQSMTSSLTDATPETPTGFAPSDSNRTAFSALNGVAQHPQKRIKLSFAEKEQKRIEKEIKDRARAEEKARKEDEKRVKDAEKARRDMQREEERRQRELEKEIQRQQKAAKEEEKRQAKEQKEQEREEKRHARELEKSEKEKEKKAKEEEKLRLEEEKRKKESSQMKLNAFFKMPNPSPAGKSGSRALSPASTTSSDVAPYTSPMKPVYSDYEKIFPPFFIQSNVTLAPLNRFQRDKTALEILERDIDNILNGTGDYQSPSTFDACALFKVADLNLRVRGRQCIPVREIMQELLGGPGRPIDLTTDSQNTQIKRTRALLKSVPYKILKFAEDVRPPYIGTYTSRPKSGMRKLATNPLKRDLPGVDYDYDSEAEWEEPGEDEEDLGSEGDEEEDVEGEEDMDGFLDDADDELARNRKLVMQGELEPKSSGLCWEDEKKRGPVLKMYGYLMEVLHENPCVRTPIDPFATHYWAPVTKPITSMDPPRMPLNAVKGNIGVNAANAKPVKMFGTSDISPVSVKTSAGAKAKKLVSQEHMASFKEAVEGSDLSKIGLIEVLNKQFPKIPKAAIKGTLETFAKRIGGKEAEKRWVWTEGAA